MKTRTVKPDIVIQGIEMIGQQSVGILLGTKSRSTVSEWLARAGLEGTSINNKKYYSIKSIQDYLRYGKIDTRQIVELIREVKILNYKKNKGD